MHVLLSADDEHFQNVESAYDVEYSHNNKALITFQVFFVYTAHISSMTLYDSKPDGRKRLHCGQNDFDQMISVFFFIFSTVSVIRLDRKWKCCSLETSRLFRVKYPSLISGFGVQIHSTHIWLHVPL